MTESNETQKSKDRIEEGMVISKRKVFPFGGSKGVTLSKKWLDIQKWLGKEVSELVSVSDSIVILVPPGDEEKAKKFMRKYEADMKRQEKREAKEKLALKLAKEADVSKSKKEEEK